MASTERNVAIVGTGLIGRAWAAIFARAGWHVRLATGSPVISMAPSRGSRLRQASEKP